MRMHSFGFVLGGALIVLVTMFTNSTPVAAGMQQPLSAIAGVPGAQLNMMRLALGGWAHTCGISTNGAVMCWGLNAEGELGDGTTHSRTLPLDVRGIAGVTAIAAGEYHTCAVANGGAKCWGRNANGQLGNNSTANSSTPVDVQTSSSDSTPLSGVTAIAAGYAHTCAVASGAILCWGYNYQGQLGDGTKNQSLAPVPVPGLSGVTAITAGMSHTCALVSGGSVKCWGRNSEGQLGNKSNTESHTPVDVQTSSSDSTPLSGATALDAGDNHTCAVVNAGAKCWGWGGNGQLGINSMTSKNTPVDVFGLTSGVSRIASGGYHTCAVTTTGGAKCWGYNAHGQLGNGATSQSSAPVDVSGLADGTSGVETGHEHSCAVMSTGEVKCWGYNIHGELGTGGKTNSSVPVNVEIWRLYIPMLKK